MPGLGTVRRNAVLNHFGDITKLKQASIEDIKKVPGFGQKNAEELHAYLKRVSKG